MQSRYPTPTQEPGDGGYTDEYQGGGYHGYPRSVAGASFYLGTTLVANNRSSGALVLSDVSISGYSGSLRSPYTTGVAVLSGMGTATTRIKIVRDSNDTLLELGGTYAPTGAWTPASGSVWNFSNATVTLPTLGQDLAFSGSTARKVWVERNPTANTSGYQMTVQAGGATPGATDKSGGRLVLAPGVSTGAGGGSVRIQALGRASVSGTSDNALCDRSIYPQEVNLTDNTATSLFEVALPSGTMAGGSIEYGVLLTDGTDFQVHAGSVKYAAVNKAGVYTTNIVDETATDQVDAISSGTLSESWAILTGSDKITIQCTFNSSLTPTSMKLYYCLDNLSTQSITILGE